MMKLQYLAVLAAVLACANADAAENADANTDDIVGFTPIAVAAHEVDAIAKAIQGYVDKFHTVPPLRHQQLFPLLEGQNPQKYRFLSLPSGRRNDRGEVVDPWREPYRIEMQPGRIIVTSRKIHYVRAATLSALPAKSIAKTKSG
jgi:hypothetical protein